MKVRPMPPAQPHGDLQEVLPGIFFVSGTFPLPGPLPVRLSRNMTVIKQDDRLIIVNSVRLGEAGLAQLDTLGRVTDVVRIAGFHGSDDQFYKSHYGAKVWAIRGQRYTTGFGPGGEPYFEPDVEVDASTALPITGATLHLFSSKPPDALLVLARDGGIVVSGDCLQNWDHIDSHFSWLGGRMMKMMKFIRPHNVGPGWLKQAKPPAPELMAVLDLAFEHVLPAHGAAVLGGAKTAYRAALERAAAIRSSPK